MGGSLADLGGARRGGHASRAREVSAVELLEACQARIAERNGGEPSFDGAPGAVNAWARLYPSGRSRRRARPTSGSPREGDAAPLLVRDPHRVKDLYGVAGCR